MDATDHELLRQFAAHRGEDAFRRLVNRHVGMVFSVARRVTDDPQLAEEVAQTTFATLAQKADQLRPDDVPAGWLYHTARHLALRAVRSEQRRRQREHIAATMNTDEPGPNVVAEHLEAAMDQLPPADRDALVLRFFEDRNLRDVGHELGMSEDAARMRVNRALEKLRGVFGKLGITGSAAWLGSTLTTSATASVPAGLGATITTTIMGGTAVAAATTALVSQTTSNTMTTLLNLQTTAAVLVTAAVTSTSTYLVKKGDGDNLRDEQSALTLTHSELTLGRQQAMGAIQLNNRQIERLSNDLTDVQRLRREVEDLQRITANSDLVRNENARLQNEIVSLSNSRSNDAGTEPQQLAAATTAKAPKLLPGKGTDQVQFGQSVEAVRAKLGDPIDPIDNALPRLMSYPSLGIDIWFTRTEPRKVMLITAGSLIEARASNFKGELEGGLRIGSARAEVIAKLGQPTGTQNMPDGTQELEYRDKGLKLRFNAVNAGHVIMFTLRETKPATP